MKSKKAFASYIEVIIVLITLLIALSVFFPGFSFNNRWSEALMKLKSRDLIITAERSGSFYPCVLESSCFKNNFLDLIIPTNKTNIIPWSEVEGTVKNQISISCNCSTAKDGPIQYLYSAFNGLTINGREINAKICYTDLESSINPCMESSDILIIWGYKDLSSAKYRDILKQYMKYGGVVEVMDFPSGYSFGSDYTQQQIFGISGGGAVTPTYDIFIKPANANQITYQSYKFFYHIPLQISAGTTGVSTVGCTQNMTGNFIIRQKSYPFSICNGATVYFDTNGDGKIDSPISGRFQLSYSGELLNYTLKYVSSQWIKIKFEQSYRFLDFVKTAATSNVMPQDGNYNRILLRTDSNDGAVIINGSKIVQTAWIADFSRDPSKMGDDHKNMLLSLIFGLSNKKAFGVVSPNVKVGYATSYLGVNATDMYEIFRLNLGLGYPY
jgi:hypothetical protein